MFLMQPMSQIAYHKVATSNIPTAIAFMTGAGVPRNGLPMVWKHPGGFYVWFIYAWKHLGASPTWWINESYTPMLR